MRAEQLGDSRQIYAMKRRYRENRGLLLNSPLNLTDKACRHRALDCRGRFKQFRRCRRHSSGRPARRTFLARREASPSDAFPPRTSCNFEPPRRACDAEYRGRSFIAAQMPPSLEADAQIPPNPTAIIIDAARNLLLPFGPPLEPPEVNRLP